MTAQPLCDNPCKGAFSYSHGIKGRNADKILFVLNRADSRLLQQSLFNNTHLEALIKSPTGKAFREIVDYCNLSFDDIYITNLFKCLLLGDRTPAKKEYERCAKVLEEQVRDFAPLRIIAFGSRVYESMFPMESASKNFEKMVSEVLYYQNTPTLVSNHPCKLCSIISKTKEKHYRIIEEFLII